MDLTVCNVNAQFVEMAFFGLQLARSWSPWNCFECSVLEGTPSLMWLLARTQTGAVRAQESS